MLKEVYLIKWRTNAKKMIVLVLLLTGTKAFAQEETMVAIGGMIKSILEDTCRCDTINCWKPILILVVNNAMNIGVERVVVFLCEGLDLSLWPN